MFARESRRIDSEEFTSASLRAGSEDALMMFGERLFEFSPIPT